jgi:Flp pilus assembly pilin Flp
VRLSGLDVKCSTLSTRPNTITTKGANNMLKKFLKDETGAELAEYAVGVALLVAIGLVVYKVLGNAINTSNSATGADINSAAYP